MQQQLRPRKLWVVGLLERSHINRVCGRIEMLITREKEDRRRIGDSLYGLNTLLKQGHSGRERASYRVARKKRLPHHLL